MDKKPSPYAFPFGFPFQFPAVDQPILPGWTLGNVVVNEQNSSAPDTERQIVAGESYGRQIGRLMDAVMVLIAELGPKAAQNEAFNALKETADHVEAIKLEAARARLGSICNDLESLARSPKGEDRQAYKDLWDRLNRGLKANPPP